MARCCLADCCENECFRRGGVDKASDVLVTSCISFPDLPGETGGTISCLQYTE